MTEKELIQVLVWASGGSIVMVFTLLKIMANIVVKNIKSDIHECQDNLVTLINCANHNADTAHKRLDQHFFEINNGKTEQ